MSFLRVPFQTATALSIAIRPLLVPSSTCSPFRRSFLPSAPPLQPVPSLPRPALRLASTMASDPIVEALKKFTACDVADALLKLKVPHGGLLAGITLWSPERQAGATKIVGPAYTVQYALNSDPAPKVAGHYIDGIPAGAVVFISSPPTPNAVFGGLMSTRAQASGAAGTVIDGRLRDLQEHRDLGYPVFARDASTTAPQEVAKVVGVDVAVTFQGAYNQGVVVSPGDYIVGDLNGVVVLPRALAAQALPLMAPQVAADEQMAVAIKAGMTFVEASKTFRGK